MGFLFVLLGAFLQPLCSQSIERAAPDRRDKNIVATHLRSTPQSLLRALERRGTSFHGTLVTELAKELPEDHGEAEAAGRHSFDLFAAIDGKKLFGLNGTTGLVRLKHHLDQFGQGGDDAAQVLSNMDAPSRTTLYELWIEQRLWSGNARFKFGKIDANTEFAVVESAGDFLNSSMGYSPTVMGMPSYPEPQLGFGAFLRPGRNYSLGLGVFRTVSSGTLSIIEPGLNWTLPESDLRGHVNVGYWRRDGTMARMDGGVSSVSQGFYSVAEQAWWRQTIPRDRGERTLSSFFQFGQADGQVSAFARHVGGGVVLQAPLAVRSHDSLGVGATWVRLGGMTGGTELVFEGHYKAVFTKHVALVQDFQFLRRRGGTSPGLSCLVAIPRLVISF